MSRVLLSGLGEQKDVDVCTAQRTGAAVWPECAAAPSIVSLKWQLVKGAGR